MNAPRPALRPLDDALVELLGHVQPLEGTEMVSTFDADGQRITKSSAKRWPSWPAMP